MAYLNNPFINEEETIPLLDNSSDEEDNINENNKNYDRLLNIIFNINIEKKKLEKKLKNNNYVYINKIIIDLLILGYLVIFCYLYFFQLNKYISEKCHYSIFTPNKQEKLTCYYSNYNNYILSLSCSNNKNYNLTINNKFFDIYKYINTHKEYNKIYTCPSNNNLYFLNIDEQFNFIDWSEKCVHGYNTCFERLFLIIGGIVIPFIFIVMYIIFIKCFK